MNIRNKGNHKGKKVLALLLTTLLASGVLTGCGAADANVDADAGSLRVAVFPNITHVQGLMGKESGAFQKAVGAGTKIIWTTYNAGSDEIQAFLSGSEDIGYIGPGPAVNAYVKSHGDVQIIAGATDAGELLVSRKGEHITSVKELAGKKVGVPQFGNTQHLTLLHLLQANGLKPTTQGGTVEIVQAKNPDVKSLFDKNELDAALVPEPWGTTLLHETGAQVVLNEKNIWRGGKYATTVIIARRDYVQRRANLIQHFLQAHVALTNEANSNPQKAETQVNAQIQSITQKQLQPQIISKAFPRMLIVTDPAEDSVRDFYQFSKDAGYIKEDNDLKTLFNLTLLKRAQQIVGSKTTI